LHKNIFMICIYHSRDLDGWMSAAIVKHRFPDMELMGWDYGNEIPDLSQYDKIIMVDISFPMEIMAKYEDKLTWIDHHASAISDYNKFMNGFHNILCGRSLNSKFAACELTWQYFFPNNPMPELVRLLGRYDCFGHKGTEEERKVLEFQYGARQLIYDVNTALINLSASCNLDDKIICDSILKEGKAIYSYLCTEAKGIYTRKFDINFDGYKFACVNQDRFNPINFGINYHKDGYEGFSCFWYVNGQWTYSLYNDNGLVDCSIICKNRGGGGHKGAAGFQTKDIILK